MGSVPGCPDVGGTYANQAEGSEVRLSSLLLPGRAANAARSVSLSLESEPQRLVVSAGSQQAVLEQGRDFNCESGALRLAGTRQRRINLGSFVTQDVETIHTLSRAADGALQAATATREHSVHYGKAVSGPLRQGAVLRWPAIIVGK